MFDVIGLVKSGFDFAARMFGYQQQRDAERNTQAMREAAMRRDEQQANDKTAQAIKDRNTDEIRKELAE